MCGRNGNNYLLSTYIFIMQPIIIANIATTMIMDGIEDPQELAIAIVSIRVNAANMSSIRANIKIQSL